MSLCVIAGGKVAVFALSAFTLSWMHSVEKTAWEEDWQAGAAGLRLVEARVKGSGAGMDPPEGSVLSDGWWIWVPTLPPQERLVLAASGATGAGWSICGKGECTTVGASAEEPVVIEWCDR